MPKALCNGKILIRMNKISYILLLWIFGGYACNDFKSVNCSDCYTSDPDSASLSILLTINSQNPEVMFYLYEGKADQGTLIFHDTIGLGNFSLWLPTHHYYAAKAVYLQQYDTVVAFDGCSFKAKEVENECNFNCYVFEKEQLDLRLGK